MTSMEVGTLVVFALYRRRFEGGFLLGESLPSIVSDKITVSDKSSSEYTDTSSSSIAPRFVDVLMMESGNESPKQNIIT